MSKVISAELSWYLIQLSAMLPHRGRSRHKLRRWASDCVCVCVCLWYRCVFYKCRKVADLSLGAASQSVVLVCVARAMHLHIHPVLGNSSRLVKAFVHLLAGLPSHPNYIISPVTWSESLRKDRSWFSLAIMQLVSVPVDIPLFFSLFLYSGSSLSPWDYLPVVEREF